MKTKLLVTILLSGFFLTAQAARPTITAYFTVFRSVTDHKMDLKWYNGNGSGRIIVMREGNYSSWKPSDYTTYSADAHFGQGTDVDGAGSYIVYNGGGSVTSVAIDSLKPCTNYYFTIFEHDNAGNNILYLTSNMGSDHEQTFLIVPEFKIIAKDSCEAHNSYTFVNTTRTNLSGLTYEFNFGDNTTSSLDSVIHLYKKISGAIPVSLKASPNNGCKSTNTKPVNVYPKATGYIDFATFEDTQCFIGNYFEIDPKPILSQLPKSITYYWNVGDSSPITTFKKLKYHYAQPGTYNVEVELRTNVNLAPTSCADTLRMVLEVLADPTMQLAIPSLKQCLANNLFSFNNNDNSSASYLWQFGDGQTSSTRNTQHSYQNAGTYQLTHTVTASYGCSFSDTMYTTVASAINSSFNGLDTAYCPSDKTYFISPVMPGGTFNGYPMTGNYLIPKKPGNYTLSYAIRLANCSDSTSKNFRIRTAPIPALGRDTLILNSQSITLDAGAGSSYLWSTLATSRTLTINGATAPKGSTRYSVIVTDQQGCKGYDTTSVSVDFVSNIHNHLLNSFLIYPNPVHDHITIRTDASDPFEWKVLNHEGKNIMSGDAMITELDCSGLADGIYIFEIRNKSGVQQLKFVKL